MLATKTLADSVNYSNPLSPENVIYNTPSEPNPSQIQPRARVVASGQSATSIRATKTISEEALRQYLQSKGSPLDVQAERLGASPYWSTIIGICVIEENGCSINPNSSNNFFGIMCSGHLCRYPTTEAGIEAVETFLAKAEANGRTTIESFRGWYCYEANTEDHICWNWEAVVIKTKALVESLQ